jgi:hypothetical protein
MEVQITISEDGSRAQVETISSLEDLWHDFEFFKSAAVGVSSPTGEQLVVKRHQRAALLFLIFYLEGVVNSWLKELLPETEWPSVERKCLELKIDAVEKRAGVADGKAPDIGEAKKIRNTLVHIKPGGDLDLYDRINAQLLESTEASVLTWLAAMEAALRLQRHPNTKEETRDLRDALGESDPETEASSNREEKRG